MKSSVIGIFLAALLASTAAPILAADNGLYVYGSAGTTESKRKSQADAAITGLGITAFTSSADDSSNGYQLQLGYKFNRFVAIEGGYVDLGKYNYSAASTAPVVATRTGNVKADAWNVGLVGSLPIIDSFSLIAKAGAFDYKLKYHCDGTVVPCANPDRSKSETALYYGVGADWKFVGNWFARAEYQVFQDVGSRFSGNNLGTSKADIKMGSIGVGYQF